MKVERINASRVFSPIFLSITIETAEEQEVLMRMCGENLTTPQVLAESARSSVRVHDFEVLSNFLDKVFRAIQGGG